MQKEKNTTKPQTQIQSTGKKKKTLQNTNTKSKYRQKEKSCKNKQLSDDKTHAKQNWQKHKKSKHIQKNLNTVNLRQKSKHM